MKSFTNFLEAKKKTVQEPWTLHEFEGRPVSFPSFEAMKETAIKKYGFVIDSGSGDFVVFHYEGGSGDTLGIGYPSDKLPQNRHGDFFDGTEAFYRTL